MFKPRNKYIYCNYDNLIQRIEKQKTHFTPYEFMSLRYACCETIAYCHKKWNEWKHFDSKTVEGNHCKLYKNYIKKFQHCINVLDSDFKLKRESYQSKKRLATQTFKTNIRSRKEVI